MATFEISQYDADCIRKSGNEQDFSVKSETYLKSLKDQTNSGPLAQTTAARLTPKSVWTLTAQCPFCGGVHKHGGGIGEKPEYGGRVAHCGLGAYEMRGVQP